MMVMDATLRVSRVVQVSFKPCAVFESYIGGPEGVGSMQQKGFLESIVRQRDPYFFVSTIINCQVLGKLYLS